MGIDKRKLTKLIKDRYIIENESFIVTPKNNARDRIEVEIGDTKEPTKFLPQVKIKRWDNEVNFSARLIDTDTSEPIISGKNNKIIWAKGNKEAHFYEKEISEEHPEGAFELEAIFNTRPDSNIVRFSIETKGLEFFYQPELTQEEKDKGNTQPENVIGSYAVYYKDTPRNIVGGKEYKVGKFGHIYRPKISDSTGAWTWGSLELDIEGKEIRVVIPQEFLNKAIYPVIVDPTFGYTSIGAQGSQSIYYETWLQNMISSVFTLSEIGTPVSISAYLKDGGTNVYSIKSAIYASDKTTKTNETTNLTGQNDVAEWKTMTVASPTELSAGDYWISYIISRTSGSGWTGLDCYDTGGANSGNQNSDISSYELPTSFTGTNNTKINSIYCTYTAGGGGTATNSERSAKTTGKNTSNAERSAKTTGKSTSNSERSAKITGKATANSERSAKLTGEGPKDYTRQATFTLPADDTGLATSYTAQEILDVDDSDDTRVGITGNGIYFIHQFIYKNPNNNSTDNIAPTWEGQSNLAPSASAIILQVYNRTSEEWETIDSDNASNANTDITLTGSITANLDDYYDASHKVSFRIYQAKT